LKPGSVIPRGNSILSEKLRKYLVYASLVLALIWAYFNFTGNEDKKDKRPRRAQPVKPIAPRAKTGTKSTALHDSIYIARDRVPWGPNPFYHSLPVQPGRTQILGSVEMRLLGVLFREYQAQALINGRVVSVGDYVGGYRVSRIFRDSVIVVNAEHSLTLRVTKESS